MSFSILRLEYTKNLKCCVADWNGERGFSKRERREIRLSFNAGLSYSQRDGVSANAGVGIGLGGKKPTGSLNLGVSYNKRDGFGTSVGISSNNNKITHGMGLNITRSEYGGWGADVSTDQYGPGNLSGGLAYTQRDGFTVSVNVNGTNAISYNSQSGLSGNGDFMSQYAMNNGLAQGVAEDTDTSEPNSAQQHNNTEQGAQVIEGAGFSTSRREGEGHVIGFSDDDGPNPAHGTPGVHDSGQTVTSSGSVEGRGGRPLSASDIAEFKADWKKESPAQTDASLAALKKAGYDTSGLEKFVTDYRNQSKPGYVNSNQTGSPIVVTGSRTPTIGERAGSLFGSIADGAKGLWNKVTGGLSSTTHYTNTPGEGLPHQFNANGEGFYNVAGQGTYMEHKYGQKPLVDTLSNAISDWHKNNPNSPIPVNDLGYKSGGNDPNVNNDPKIVSHHKTGNQVDLGYIVSDGGKYGGDYNNNPHYDRDKTIEFIKTISRNIPEGVNGSVKFNDPKVHEYFDKNKLPNLQMKSDDLSKPNAKVMHSNHLHLQLDLPKLKQQ